MYFSVKKIVLGVVVFSTCQLSTDFASSVLAQSTTRTTESVITYEEDGTRPVLRSRSIKPYAPQPHRKIDGRQKKRSRAFRFGFQGTRHGRSIPHRFVSQEEVFSGEELPEGTIIDEQIIDEGMIEFEEVEGELIESDNIAPYTFGATCCGQGNHGYHGYGNGNSGCSTCNHPLRWLCFPWISMENISVFSGVFGTKGPANRGQDASFGIYEGFNWGSSAFFLSELGLSMQFGVQAAQSNFSGADFTNDERNQLFVTGGFFHRVDCGLQAGIVVDYLHDDWYYTLDLAQVRGELSWVYPDQHEIGFMFAASTGDDEDGVVVAQTTDTYAFFYRHRLDDCGASSGRIYVGVSGESDGLLGGDILLPVTDRWALSAGFTYLIPNEDTGSGGHREESWNLGINFVWYPRGNARSDESGYNRPLMNVANNGSLLLDGTFQ